MSGKKRLQLISRSVAAVGASYAKPSFYQGTTVARSHISTQTTGRCRYDELSGASSSKVRR
jgi:hypothetical protein